MRFDRDPRLERTLYNMLAAKYLTTKPLGHLTEVLYCLTNSYMNRFFPLTPTDKELLYFAVGFGLEDVMLRQPGVAAPETVVVEGVPMTPDFIWLKDEGVDLKSTRMYPTQPDGVPKMGWPETWLEQFMAYAYMLGKTTYSVGVVYLLPPELVGGTFTWTQAEINANWAKVKSRREVYMKAVVDQVPPKPFTYNKEWECKNCKRLEWCKAQERLQALGAA